MNSITLHRSNAIQQQIKSVNRPTQGQRYNSSIASPVPQSWYDAISHIATINYMGRTDVMRIIFHKWLFGGVTATLAVDEIGKTLIESALRTESTQKNDARLSCPIPNQWMRIITDIANHNEVPNTVVYRNVIASWFSDKKKQEPA